MSKHLRKIWALVVAAAMLCTLLPLSALSVSAAQINLVTNGDFSDGTTGWVPSDGASVKTETLDAEHGPSGKFYGDVDVTVYQDIAVNANTDYTLTMDLSVPTNHISVWITGGVDGTEFYTRSKVEAKEGWRAVTYTFNSGANTYIRLALATRYWAYNYYVDNVVMMGEPTDNEVPEPENPPAPELVGNLLSNGTFEEGNKDWTLYQGTTTTEDAALTGKLGMHLTGNGGWGAMATQDIATEVGKKYLMNADLSTKATGVNIQVKSGDTAIASQWFNTAAWTKITVEFTATSTTTSIVFCGAGNGNAESVYLDDVCVTAIQEESYDGYLYNGDFETGSLSHWGYWQSTEISREAAHSGSFGCKMIGTGGWGGTLRQDFSIQPGMTYKVSFWYKPVSNGINVQLVHKDGTSIEGNYLNTKSTKEWTLWEYTFEAGYSEGVYINFCGSGIGTKDEVWVDDIKVENLSGGELDRTEPLQSGGVSIRDVSDDVRGLAFRFDMDAVGVQTRGTLEFVPNSGTVKLYNFADTLGTLVDVGAIVSNDAAAAEDLTLEKVNDRQTIQIPAKYLTSATDEQIGFAVRIINIPDRAVESQIYARPYYTYVLGGETVTVYGDMVSENYASVTSARRTIKVLAIGNSFSVDAMKHHLYDVYKSAGYDQVILGNLYVAGCSIDTHWNNIKDDKKAYEYQKNDDNGKWTSLFGRTALSGLQDEEWDIITIQQASPDSGRPDTYGNLKNIVDWVNTNKTNPNAKIFFHQTWAYQKDSTHWAFPAYYGSDQLKMYNAIMDASQNTAMKVEGIDGIIPSGTAIQNLRGTAIGDTLTSDGHHLSDTYGDYTAALMWYVSTTGGESLDDVTYIPESIKQHFFNAARAVAAAYFSPYAVTDLTETVLVAGSDFQTRPPQTGLNQIDAILGGIEKTDGYTYFDGLIMGGDYTADHGHENSVIGLEALMPHMSKTVNHNLIYSEGNHDAPTVEALTPTGNNDPLFGTYGMFVINEKDYGQFGEGGDLIAKQLDAYLDEKATNDSWGIKPIFVVCHVPLHYSYRTLLDQQGRTAMPIVDALNEGGEKGLNIIFLFGHNHSDEYDAYLGGSSVYLKKGDSMLVPSTSDHKVYQSVQLKFTYMNVGYVGGYPTSKFGSDSTLTMTTFRILPDHSVIITRYDKDGYHNLKSKGVTNTNFNDKFPPDETVYGPRRIVRGTSDKEYNGD